MIRVIDDFRRTMLALALLCAMSAAGCRWTDALKGDGFPAWSDSIGAGARGNASEAKPSGFFTDSRSEQIERNLGGGF
jgi:hypothetical protein